MKLLKQRHKLPLISVTLVGLLLTGCKQSELTPYDMKRAKEFVLSSLPALKPDLSNKYSDNPKAAALGEKLFFDEGLSTTSNVSCASCHQPDKQFQDGLKVGFGVGEGERRTMPLRGVQWSDWFFWDGRKDSQWSQALGPLETPSEHGMTRDMVGREVLTRYPLEYTKLFGDVPDVTRWPYRISPVVEGTPKKDWAGTSPIIQEEINQVFANVGKALAAYQRTLTPEENKVDRFFAAKIAGKKPSESDQFTDDEIVGFKLFTGKAKCDNCHSGPLYTDQFFHNTGVSFSIPEKPDLGRAAIVDDIKSDPFSCIGKYSDVKPDDCRNFIYMSDDPSVFEGAFKTPSLRGVSKRPPYMNAGQIDNLETVIDHYVARPDPFFGRAQHKGKAETDGSHNEVPKIELTDREKAQLLAFLKAL